LHPSQARTIGRAIGERLCRGKQIFLSTHSMDVVEGLLESGNKHLKIVRITKTKNPNGTFSNQFFILNPKKVANFSSDPLVIHSKSLDALFAKKTILCESESDCQFYQFVANGLIQKKKSYPDFLFIPVNGKGKLHKMIDSFRGLGLDLSIIVDFDIFDDESTCRRLCESCKLPWNLFSVYFKKIQQLVPPPNSISKAAFLQRFSNLLNTCFHDPMSLKETTAILSSCRELGYWALIKKKGSAFFAKGDQANVIAPALEMLASHSVFVVPYGELESFHPLGNLHGPEWVLRVIEKYPNIDNKVYAKARKFVEESCMN
jgi:hypothetical protein